MLDEFSSYEECTDTVNNMKKEKSPGLDDLLSDFIRPFGVKSDSYFMKHLKIYIIKVKCQVHKIISNFSRVQKMWKKLSEQL